MCIRQWSPTQDRCPKMPCGKIPTLTATQPSSTHLRPEQLNLPQENTQTPRVAITSCASGFSCEEIVSTGMIVPSRRWSQTVPIFSGLFWNPRFVSICSFWTCFTCSVLLVVRLGVTQFNDNNCRFMWLSRQCNSWAHTVLDSGGKCQRPLFCIQVLYID
jgi:hypothetical protein